jgi:hypothetical protein
MIQLYQQKTRMTVQLIKRVKISSENAGLKLNIKKTRVMSTGEQANILIDEEEGQ